MISQEQLQTLRNKLPELRILVIGDLMLDRYLWGKVSRISPEAPVPVVEVFKSESRPGGAANVALNLAALGAQVSLCGIIGEDTEGQDLKAQLEAAGFETELVRALPGRKTTTKTRVIGQQQHILRVDSEDRDVVKLREMGGLWPALSAKLDSMDAVIFEDYDKGVLSMDLIEAVTLRCKMQGIPVIVDPKFRQFMDYRGCSLFKPNLKELNEAMGTALQNHEFERIKEAVLRLRKRMPHAATLITLSENGMLAVDESGTSIHVPAHYRKITDVSGAGDTVVALMGAALAAGLDLEAAATVANMGGGLVCEEVGVVPIDADRLFEELG